MITVYIDMLFIVNFIMEFLIISLTAKISGSYSPVRKLFGSLAGAIYSCGMFFIPIKPLYSFFCMVLFSCLMVKISLKGSFLKNLGVFWGVSILAGGIIFAIFLKGGVFISNGSVYFSAGITNLILGAFLLYISVKIVCKILDRLALSRKENVILEIKNGEKTATLNALCDTGNMLSEPFTGLPVCIIARHFYETLHTDNDKLYIIPYKTVDKPHGVMLGILPEIVTITTPDGKRYFPACIITSTDISIKKGVDAIINPQMLTNNKVLSKV